MSQESGYFVSESGAWNCLLGGMVDMVQDIRKLRIIFVLPLNILSFSLQQTVSLNSQIVNNLGFVDCIISITMLSSMAEA